MYYRIAALALLLSISVGWAWPTTTEAQVIHFTRGDVNADGTVDLSDPVKTLGFLFLQQNIVCLSAADVDDNGDVDITDAIGALNYLFLGGTPPAFPGPGVCDADPTPDALPCPAFGPCPQPAFASFFPDPPSGDTPLEVNFDSSASIGAAPLTFAWDFGDGTTGSGAYPQHVYTTAGTFTVQLTVTNSLGDMSSTTDTVTARGPGVAVGIDFTSPANGEDEVAVTRETIIYFDTPIDPATVTNSAIYAELAGQPIPFNLHLNAAQTYVDKVTIFYPALLPSNSVIQVYVDGDELLDPIGRAVDADGDGVEGGLYVFEFETLNLTSVPNTAVCGRVFASEFGLIGGQQVNVPLQGVTITVDGVAPGVLSAITDELGSFRLEPVPAGTFFVHIDGRTVSSALIDGALTPTLFPGGPYYPFVGKPFHSVAGTEVQMPDIFLPLVEEGALVTVSATEDTIICLPDEVLSEFPELEGLCITVPAGSLFADDGTPGGAVGVSPVDPARLPGPLPAGLEFAMVITVQTDGATNFEEPAPICFPNLPDPVTGLTLEPGAQSALWSFNHDTGRWEVAGPMTVTADGTMVCTNPGVGILAPGWHAVNPGVPVEGGDITDPDTPDREVPNANGQEPVNDDGDSDSACKQGRKVYLHNGEENFERIDLTIPGRGDINFVMRRRYRSQFQFNGPIGYGWDFDYNDTIQVLPNGNVKRCNGRGRVVEWEKVANGVFTSPRGHFRTILQRPDLAIEMRSPDGFRRLYHRDGRLAAHIDRHGNRMVFEYDAFGDLELVIDPYGREIQFEFDFIAGGFRRLARIRDFTGRVVEYSYDVRGDLIEVRTPVVTGTSTGNNFPQGRVERYTYSTGFFLGELNHNLLSVTFPNEVANGGPPAIAWEYGTTFGQPSFDRVIREHLGGGEVNSSGVPAGGTMEFEYEMLNENEPPGQLDLPRGRVLVTERNGTQYEYYVNELDHHIMSRRLTQGLRPGEPPFYETRFFYDEDGQLTRTIHPEGNETLLAYDSSGARGAQKNIVEVRRVADPTRGGGEDLVTTMTYEPIFNRLLTRTDPRGNATNFTPPLGVASAARYTTRYYFDYQEGSTTSILNLAEDLGVDLDPDGPGPMTAAQVASQLSVGTDLNADAVTNQKSGNVVRVEHPTVQLVDEAGGISSQPIITESQWNSYGLLVRSIDAEGNVETRNYYPGDRPANATRFTSIFVPNSSQDEAGYLQQRVFDSELSGRRTTSSPPTQLATRFEYDEVGNIVRRQNPRGVVTETEYNALNEPVVTTRGIDVSAAVNSGELITGESALAYQTKNFYDFNGLVIRTEVDNRDSNTVGVGTTVEHEFEYDILKNLVEKRIEVDATTNLTWQFRYDENELLEVEIQPQGNRKRTVYDERNLVYQVIEGELTAEASTVRSDYDDNGNIERSIDAEGGDITQYIYDGFDRQTQIVDRMGNVSTFEYDPQSNIVHRTVMGHPAGNPGAANVLLSEDFSSHDEVNRTYQIDRALFLASGFSTVDPVVLLDQNSDGMVTERVVHDALSREVAKVQDDLAIYSKIYDGAGRIVQTTDPLGNTMVTTYDANSNVITVTETELATSGIVAAESFSSHHVYDQFDRLVRRTDSGGQTHTFEYDSRDNLIRETDARGVLMADPLGIYPGFINGQGNVRSYFHDGLNRVVRTDRELRVGGIGSNAIDTSNPNNPDGIVSISFGFDGNSRLVARTDDNGNTTSFEYDALDRLTRQINDDGTDITNTYDDDSNLIATTDENGTTTTTTYDANDRATQVNVSPTAGILGTTLVTFEYDGLNRLTRSVDDNGGSNQVCEYTYDSLSRLLEQRYNGLATSTIFSGDGKSLTLRYPGTRQLDYTYDALDRTSTVADGGGSIASYEWIGPALRPLRITLGNGVVETWLDPAGASNIGYDGLRRIVEMRADLPLGGVAMHREYTYDRANRRTSEIRRGDFDLTDSFAYDSVYRLSLSIFDANGLAGATPRDLLSRSYLFDGVGNRTSVDEDSISMGLAQLSYVANNMNEYTTVDGAARSHSASGNLLSDGALSYSYDYRDRLVEVRNGSGDLIAEYDYFANGRRAEVRHYGSVVPNQLDQRIGYFYRGDQLIEEVDLLTSNSLATFVWDDRYVDSVLQFERSPNHALGSGVFYLHQNSRFDVVAVSDVAGALVETLRYDDFGAPDSVSTIGNPYLFQGRRYDQESGLYYFRARYYDPTTGRFVQRDSDWDEDNHGNAYTFAGNSPMSSFDPSGLNQNAADAEEQFRRFVEGQIRHQDELIRLAKEGMNPLEKFVGYGERWDDVYAAAIEKKRLKGLLDGRDYVGEFRQQLNDALSSPQGIAGRFIADPYTSVVLGKSAMTFQDVPTGERVFIGATALAGTFGPSLLRRLDDVGDISYVRRVERNVDRVDPPSTALVRYDPSFAAKQTLKNGRVHVDDLRRMIPDSTPNTFRASDNIAAGSKFKFDVNGTKIEVKWHAPDANAAQKFPGSNSGTSWTAQIKVGNQLLGADGNFYKKPNNITHIPVDF